MNATKRSVWILVLTVVCLLIGEAATVWAQPGPEELLADFRWRCIGPGNFAGRVVDVEALESDFTHVIVASASGGVWKSVNAGITWEPIFDHYGAASIGDIKIFQKDPNIIWVGTGEANNRNSVAWGDGIYKSTDGGKTFVNMGLRDTYQIARIVTHPDNPDIVYVAAVGYLWGYIGERGLFKTTDGGKTWEKLTNGLPNDGKTGATDLVMDPTNPDVLYAAFYQRLRKPYRFDSGGPNGGIFKSTDGGQTWRKLTNGLPKGPTGRIGLAIYRRNPNIVMAIIEHGFQPLRSDPDYTDMSKLGTGVYRSEDGGETWHYLNRYNNRPFYYSQIRINPCDDQLVYVLTTTIQLSTDGGKTFRPGGLEYEGGLDFHAMWLDPNNKNRFYLGKDKGLTLTHDGGKTFQLFDNMPIGQFYAVGVDMRDPYYVYGGTQDNGTWGGPSFSKDVRGILNDSWWKLHWGDGMFVQIDPTDWRKVYTEAENGSFRRYDALTRRVEMSPPSPQNIVNYDEFVPGGRRGNRLPQQFRFNWRAPLVMSVHNPLTLYLCGNHLFKTVDGGYHWLIVSPDLSTNDPVKTDPNTGGLTRDVTGAETHCTIVAFSESPRNPKLLWAGTDDGNVHLTRDGGVTWINVTKNIPEVPKGLWVSSLQASHFDEGTCYVTFDGHRSADLGVWLFKTTDYGKTWQKLTNGIPDGNCLYVVREDPKNPNLLFAGSELACYISLNGGQKWHRFMNNMPTVAFHDLVIHPRDYDLVAGTHGRGIWILDDITPLQQLTPEVLKSELYLFENRPATIWEDASRGGVRGHFYFAGENPPYIPKREDVVRAKLINGGLITYYWGRPDETTGELTITNLDGTRSRQMTVTLKPGIHRILWDLRWDPSPQQMQQIVRQFLDLIRRIQEFKTLTPEQRQFASEAKTAVEMNPTAETISKLREKLFALFQDQRLLRTAYRLSAQGDEVLPGEYILNLSAGTCQAVGKILVRQDPILTQEPGSKRGF